MSRGIRRKPGGQFAAGQSGNPDGARLRKPRELLTITDLYRIQLEVAGEIVGSYRGKPITRFEAAARLLAKGDSTNRLATRDFLDRSKSATLHFANLERANAQKKPRS